MIPQQTFESYPVFGDNATKVQPDNAKYSAGFQQADVLPAEWVNWFWNKSSKGVTDLNAGVASMETEVINVLTAAGKTPNVNTNNQLVQSIQYLIAAAKSEAILAAHPIGSLYWSSDSTNPNSLFGGTWVQIKDKFVWAKGDSDTVNDTGGAKTVTLETANLPSHYHTLNDGNTSSSGTIETAGFRAVTTYTDGPIETGSTTSKTSTGDMSANSTGSFKVHRSVRSGVNTVVFSGEGNTSIAGDSAGGVYLGEAASSGSTDKVTINVAHTHNMDHRHSVTSSGYIYGKTDSVGSGTAVDKMPPYIIKYCWERTA